MKNTELNTLVEKIDNIEQLANDLNNAIDEADAQKALEAHGLNISLEDLATLVPANEELTEDDLLAVAGGCKCGGFRGFIINCVSWLMHAAGINFTCADCGH